MLKGMAECVPAVLEQFKGTFLQPCVEDADLFLSVGLSLLDGNLVAGKLGHQERVQSTLDAINAETLTNCTLFDRDRTVDFSLFKVRGHYNHSEKLKKYFRAMMWCGTIDMRVAGDADEVSTRELGSSCVMLKLLQASDNFKLWTSFDNFFQKFIGITDSMTFGQLETALKECNVTSLDDIKQEDSLIALQQHIMKMDMGTQAIQGHFYFSPDSATEQKVLPRTFTVMGQKFTLDNWVTANVVYDRVLDEHGAKVGRRVPSCLDVAYAALANDHVRTLLAQRMTDTNGVPFRDGLPYHHNLTALRKVIDSLPSSIWESSIYFQWLATLRALSLPLSELRETRDSIRTKEGTKEVCNETSLPQIAMTQPWAMKALNTQLASWTQLRHDTILYAKQSGTFSTMCDYPAGYVEPNTVFWRQFVNLAKFTLNALQTVEWPSVETTIEQYGYQYKMDSAEVRQPLIGFYQNFVVVLEKLLSISEKQAANEELTDDMKQFENKVSFFGGRLSGDVKTMSDVRFLKNVMEETHGSGATRYLGWYPTLFLKEPSDAGKWDPLIADVHTDMPDANCGDPGCVLHEAVGNVHMMLAAVDRGDSVTCYAGPVLSHYEFAVPGVSRKDDKEWRTMLKDESQCPPHPEWTKSYLVPGSNPAAKQYRHRDDDDGGAFFDE